MGVGAHDCIRRSKTGQVILLESSPEAGLLPRKVAWVASSTDVLTSQYTCPAQTAAEALLLTQDCSYEAAHVHIAGLPVTFQEAELLPLRCRASTSLLSRPTTSAGMISSAFALARLSAWPQQTAPDFVQHGLTCRRHHTLKDCGILSTLFRGLV